MATVRKLEPDEVQSYRRRGTRVDLSPYEAGLRGLQVGDWGLIELESDDKVPTVKRRYTMAAKNQQKSIVYKRKRNNTIPFEIRAPESK
jgi:hypothetical protein